MAETSDIVSTPDKLDWAELRQLLTSRLTLPDVSEIWFDTFNSKIENEVPPNADLTNRVIELIDRVNRHGIAGKLIACLHRHRPDLWSQNVGKVFAQTALQEQAPLDYGRRISGEGGKEDQHDANSPASKPTIPKPRSNRRRASSQKKADPKIDLPKEVKWQSIEVYARLYQLEHWLRELVYLELKAHFGSDWWIEAEGAIKRSSVASLTAEASRSNDQAHQHMATPESDPLWFLSFETLLAIVFDDKLWSIFECYLTTKNLLEAKFTEIIPIRNRITYNRPLHEDDLDRVKRLLRDLDKGFWKFCTSFNNKNPFVREDRTDPVYQHFQSRMGFDYAEAEPNSIALVGSTIGMHQNISVEFSKRPSANSTKESEVGRIYHFTYSIAGRQHQGLDYKAILERTKKYHRLSIYIIMDSFQQSLYVSFPALLPSIDIINAAESFYNACGQHFDFSYRSRSERLIEKSLASLVDDYELLNQPFERIASEWPHYVLPPGHPFEVLTPDCPCSFFGT